MKIEWRSRKDVDAFGEFIWPKAERKETQSTEDEVETNTEVESNLGDH